MPFNTQGNASMPQDPASSSAPPTDPPTDPPSATPEPLSPTVRAAVEAFHRRYQAVPIRQGAKRPLIARWQHTRWTSETAVREAFEGWTAEGVGGVGLLLGEVSGNLVDIDLDHPLTRRLTSSLLPPTAMRHGRAGNRNSHWWYRVTGDVPGYRKYTLPDKSTIVEFRSDNQHQTIVPPSVHTSGEPYVWEGEPWGGDEGPAEIDGAELSIQVGLLALCSVLLERWPAKGSRHDAYLALAGGLLRWGDDVHPWWARNAGLVIDALAYASRDEEGPETRVKEVMGSTLERLRSQGTDSPLGDNRVTGWTTLAGFIGDEHAESARRLAREIEALGRFNPTEVVRLGPEASRTPTKSGAGGLPPRGADSDALESDLPPEHRDPIAERSNSWAAIDMEPYLSGKVPPEEPGVLVRVDGAGLMYPGKVNSLYGPSESAKSWLALVACRHEMDQGGRALYLDFEDGPNGTLSRMSLLGVAPDDIHDLFRYVMPEGPLASMQRGGFARPSVEGRNNEAVFADLLAKFNPGLIVVDGMTSLYGLHGLDTNKAADTDVIGTWLKSLTRSDGGQRTVIVIDHTGKSAGAGSSPIGAHHKIALIQGTAIQVAVTQQPMPGRVGRLNLSVHKDRPGAVRAVSVGTSRAPAVAYAVIDSTTEGITQITLEVPSAGAGSAGSKNTVTAYIPDRGRGSTTALPESSADRLLRVLREEGDWMTAEAIAAAAGRGSIKTVRNDLGTLVSAGYLERRREGVNLPAWWRAAEVDPEEADDDD